MNLLPLLTLAFLLPGIQLRAQKWDFIKEKEGIRIYTSTEPSTSLKSFKGEMTIKTTMDKVKGLIGNPANFDWWADNITVKVLSFEPEKYIRYYVSYDVPWPMTDRDLCVEAKISTDPVTGARTVYATPLPDLVPQKKDAVRIRHYWQKWTITPMANGYMKLVIEGFVDPAGNVPSWLYNMVITDTPLKVMREVKQRVAM
jgi:hypothetical protein